MSSAFQIFDWIFGLNYSLKAKRIAIAGGDTGYGRALLHELQRDGVSCIKDFKLGHSTEALVQIFKNTDILILAEGRNNLDTKIFLINLFCQHTTPRPGFDMTLPEVWSVDFGMDADTSFGTPFPNSLTQGARFLSTMRALYNNPSFVYRHILLASCGSGNLEARSRAAETMWWIRRGGKFVPVGQALMGYVRLLSFIWWTRFAVDEVEIFGNVKGTPFAAG